MKKIILAVLILGLLSGCTDPEKATSVLSAQGYKDIEVTGYNLFSCGQDDQYHTGFVATSVTGQRVTGTVCSGFLKGTTVRFD